MFPCFPFLPLIDSKTPARSPHLTYYDVLILFQLRLQLKLQLCYYFRGSFVYLQQPLSTLHAIISGDYARLDSGGWLALAGQDWLPAGNLRGVSLPIYLFAL